MAVQRSQMRREVHDLQETAVKDANKSHLEKLRSQIEEKQKRSAALKSLAVAEGQVIQSSLQLEKATIEVSLIHQIPVCAR